MKALHIFVLLAVVLSVGTIVATHYEKAKTEVVAQSSFEKSQELIVTRIMRLDYVSEPNGEEVDVHYVPQAIGLTSDGILRRSEKPPSA